MKSSQVRELARRYAAGQLSQENYRNQRRTLIDSVADGSQPLVYKELAVRAPGRNNRLKLAAVAAVVVILAGVALRLTWKATHSPRKGTAEAATAPAAPPPLPAPGPDLVRSFVETNDWSDGSLESLAQRWQTLGTDDQAKAKDSMLYPRLVAGLRGQITSEKAVASSMSGADAHLIELTKVAKDLGIPATP
ncbi:MAG: hypothetical protein ACM3ZT_00535 [Bacillota bacterium]